MQALRSAPRLALTLAAALQACHFFLQGGKRQGDGIVPGLHDRGFRSKLGLAAEGSHCISCLGREQRAVSGFAKVTFCPANKPIT
jgi:hypothetical protein